MILTNFLNEIVRQNHISDFQFTIDKDIDVNFMASHKFSQRQFVCFNFYVFYYGYLSMSVCPIYSNHLFELNYIDIWEHNLGLNTEPSN